MFNQVFIFNGPVKAEVLHLICRSQAHSYDGALAWTECSCAQLFPLERPASTCTATGVRMSRRTASWVSHVLDGQTHVVQSLGRSVSCEERGPRRLLVARGDPMHSTQLSSRLQRLHQTKIACFHGAHLDYGLISHRRPGYLISSRFQIVGMCSFRRRQYH